MKPKTKRIMAWILIVILVLMYVSTLVFALLTTMYKFKDKAMNIAI